MPHMTLFDALKTKKHYTNTIARLEDLNDTLTAERDSLAIDLHDTKKDLAKALRAAASYKGKYESIKNHPSKPMPKGRRNGA